MYSVKEIFYSLQGEGANMGRPAVFCRFAGCNMWSGREEDKAKSTCPFCDTDFVGTDGKGGGQFQTAEELATHISSFWPQTNSAKKFLIFTGGEPTLQLDAMLISEVKKHGFETAVETNGTMAVCEGIDWVTVSPKNLEKLIQRRGTELKLLFPFLITPEDVQHLEFKHFYLSPVTQEDPEKTKENALKALEYCLNNPQWKLTWQLHKLLGIR